MLVAEGVSRKLDPTVNMWVLAQPLIEEWMRENRGPQARLRDATETAVAQFERLPALFDRLERASQMVEEGGVRLHPDTVDALRGRDRGAWPTILLAGAVAALVAALVMILAG